MNKDSKGCAVHLETPNTFRFTICRKCGAGAPDQRICSVCGAKFCRQCQARANTQEAQK